MDRITTLKPNALPGSPYGTYIEPVEVIPTPEQQTGECSPDIYLQILVDSTSCGNVELADFLQDNAAIAACLNGGCHTEISFLQTQLALIDMAMNWARNKVDISKSRAKSTGYDRFRSESESNSQAQRTSQGTSCSFSDASSFQNFIRDSVNASRSQSDTVANSDGETQNHRWDRSTTSANGYSNVFDFAYSSTVGDGFGQHAEQTLTSGKSYSKTAPFFGPGANDIDPGNVDLIGALGGFGASIINWAEGIDINFNIFGGGEGSDDVFISFNNPPPSLAAAFLANDTIAAGYVNPGVGFVPDCPGLGCCCDDDNDPLTPPCPPGYVTQCFEGDGCAYDNVSPFPSYGRGYSVQYSVTFGVPFVGASVRIGWGQGAQFRQSHVMTQGCTRTFGGGVTNNDYDQTDISNSTGQTSTHDESQTQRDIHAIGDSRRDSRSDTTAGSASTGDAHAESHSGADRLSHNERQSSNQGTAWSLSHAESKGLTKSDSEAEAESRRYGQIFDSLQDMWLRIFKQIQEAQSIRSATAGIKVGNMESCITALPQFPQVRFGNGHLHKVSV